MTERKLTSQQFVRKALNIIPIVTGLSHLSVFRSVNEWNIFWQAQLCGMQMKTTSSTV